MLSGEICGIYISIITTIVSHFTKILCKADDTYKYVYNSDTTIAYWLDFSKYCFLYFHSVFFQYYIEPFETNWIYTAVLSEKCEYLFLDEKYHYYTDKEVKHDLCMKYNIQKKSEHSQEDGFFLVNRDAYIISRRTFTHNITDPPVFVKNPFLQISYVHPDMNSSIDIHIPNKYFIENNELLSACFIAKYLKYQELPFDFSMQYKINIMDDDINTITLTADSFIRLLEKGYEIVTIKK